VAATKKREAEVSAAECVKGQYKAFLALVPEIKKAVETFNKNKRPIPPIALPGTMKDHKLSGKLDWLRECHLAGDILLLYTHEDHKVRMLYICRHEDLYGKRAKQLNKYLKGLRG
jgi:mRNA-degrading endonuclease YafQ of YafQ-DinJ toxin-antitoxin module